MTDATFWSDFTLTLFAVALLVLYALRYPGTAKKPRKAKRDFNKSEWESL
jgi:hypothetical protein